MATDVSKPSVVFTQATPLAVWNISHGLLTDRPAVNVWVNINGVDTLMYPAEIRVMTINDVRISFSHPTAGTAVLA